MNISKVNQNGNTNFGILIDNNKKTSSLTMIGGSLTNVALDLWTAGYNDSIILDGVKIENIKYAHKTPQSGNLIVSNSTIKDSSFNKETTFVNSKLLGNISGNIVVDNSIVEATLNTNTLEVINGTTISSDISKVNNFILDNSTLTTDLNAKNITIKNDAKYNNKNITASGTLTIENHQIINNDKDKITLKSNGISTYKDSVIKNAVLDSNLNRIDFYNTNELDNVKISNDNAWDVTKHHITIWDNTKVTINDSEIINSAITQASSLHYDSEVIINNTKLVDTGIGALNNNDLYNRIPKLELNNVNYINNIENSGIFAKEITINGGYIKANKLYGTDTILIPGKNDISTQDNTKVIIKDGAIVEALVDGEELEIYNSKLTGDSLITNIKTDNSELIGKIEATNNIDISNSSIKGDIKGSELKLLNSDLNSNLIDIANNVIIENTEAKTITGNFKVGNDFKSSNTIIQGSINTTNNMELNNSNIKGDITANNLTLNNSSITNKADGSTNTINVTNDLTINNESQTIIDGNFKVGNDFKSSNTIFSGDITANNLLSDNKSTFQGQVSADSISAVGSIFKQTLTITGDSKNNVLDKATLEQGIVIDSKGAQVSVINGSEIKGEIKNEGFINVEEGSTVSELVSGSGTLSTDGAWYDKNVSMGKIEGENNTFKGDVIITNTNTEVKADNNTFLGNVSVNNGKLSATTNN
ncbi:hypothetical protein, partial [Campylobacter sp. RM12637]|uniref:hypothetical protein n=1 Tax=Campylobacter sp. RM12637 TaxID=2735734 RepID=UPI00301555B5|nr:hypothetical protein [Campylobacter sp. RM12637]